MCRVFWFNFFSFSAKFPKPHAEAVVESFLLKMRSDPVIYALIFFNINNTKKKPALCTTSLFQTDIPKPSFVRLF